jgi:hypothetical protein
MEEDTMANASMTSAKNEMEGAIRVASPWIEWLARLGYFAKGVLYLVIGILALNVAFNTGGQTPDTQDALQTIAAQPFGRVLLTLIVIGLVGYSIWLFARGIMDTEDEGSDMKGLSRRVSFVARAVGHLVLAFIALQLLMGSGGGSDGNNTASLTARTMEQPWGRWLVGLVGLGFIAVALSRFYLAYSERFREKLQLNKMSSTEQDLMIWSGRLGIASQGVVLAMIGSFLIQAAIQYDPSEARGLGGAFQELLEQPYGPWLLGLMALGFIAHGIYMFIRGRYRRIEVA